MQKKRTDRLNSLLREVISDVIKREVKNPNISELLTVTRVDITSDLRHAKVYISVIGDEHAKTMTLHTLEKASGFIAMAASKQIIIRYFPALRFIIDETVEKQMRIDAIIHHIAEERDQREETLPHDNPSS